MELNLPFLQRILFKSKNLFYLFLYLTFVLIIPSSCLKEQSAEALANAASDKLYLEWQFDSAEYYFDKVMAMENTPAQAHADYGWFLIFFDRLDDGIAHIKKATELEPDNSQWATWYAWICMLDEGIDIDTLLKKAMDINPEYHEVNYVSCLNEIKKGSLEKAQIFGEKAGKLNIRWRTAQPLCYAMKGEKEKALQIVKEIAANPEHVQDYYGIAYVYLALGDEEKAMQYINESVQHRHPYTPWMESDPFLAPLKDREDFQALISSLNLPGR